MRTLHFGVRVADRERSVSFYEALGYEVIGAVPDTSFGHLTMLKLRDDPFVTVELVHDPSAEPAPRDSALSHFVVQVNSLDAFAAEIASAGIDVEPSGSALGPDDPRTAWITDPDGNRIELVQWPAGHAEGMTAADFTTA